MTILREFSSRREQRIIDKVKLWGQGVDIGTPTHAGVEVTETTALRLSAVWRCVNLRAGTIAGLPCGVYRNQGEDRVEVNVAPDWLYEPNPEMTWFDFMERIVACLDVDGNAFIGIGARYPAAAERTGYPRELWVLDPQRIVVKRDSNGQLIYVYDGGKRTFTRYSLANQSGEVLHIRAFTNGSDRGLSPIEVARQGIGLGLVAEKHGARFFGSGQQPSGIIEVTPGPQKQVEGFVEMIKKMWVATYGGSDRSHLPAMLVGASWKPMSITNEQAQFLETRKFQVRDIARMFGIPPHKIGDLDNATFSNIEHQAIEFVTDSILPYVTRIEQAFNQLTPNKQYLKFSLNGLLRGDTQSRFAAYASAIQNGWLNRDEVRHYEDLNSVPGLDEYLQLSTLVTIDEANARADAAAAAATNGPVAANGAGELNGSKLVPIGKG